MLDLIDKTEKTLEAIALELVTMEGEDIPVMGNILNHLCDMEEDSKKIGQPAFSDLITGLKTYIEKAILGEMNDFKAFEEGLNCLQSIHRCIRNHQEYKEDISTMLDKLRFKQSDPKEEKKEPEHDQAETDSAAKIEDKKEEKEEFQTPDEDLSEEDREILSDFVIESLENLETMEVSLIDLEQNSNDPENINAIFRSFHTIKGVSAFLNLMRINKLAHNAENLLERVRSGEIEIGETIIDISSPGEVNVIITDPTQKVVNTYKIKCICKNCGATDIFVELPVGTAFAKPKYAGNIEIDVASYNICPKCRCKSFLMPAAQK